MQSFLSLTLAHCHSEIQSRLEVENVVNDMVGVVEISWMEKDLRDLRKKLAASQHLTESLRVETMSLSQDKTFYDSELDRIRSEAVLVRESLVHDVASILSEIRQVDKYQKRIRELEDRVVELVYFVKNGGRNEVDDVSSERISDQPHSAESRTSYQFADAIVDEIAAVDSETILPVQLNMTAKCPKLINNLDDKCLLLMLSFLRLSDVLFASSLNRQLFARVNQLFQNGSTIAKDSWMLSLVDSSAVSMGDQQRSNLTVEVIKVTTIEGNGTSNGTNAVNSVSVDAVTSHPPVSMTDDPPSASKNPAGEGRYFGKFSMLLAAADMLPTGLTAGVYNAVGARMNAVPSSPASSSNGSTYGKNSISSRGGAIVSSAAMSSSINGVTANHSAPSSSGGLTREIAESLSKKLSAAEMKAIINMDDTLKKNTYRLEVATADNEDLTSKLQGILTMRDFLISKLKGAEVALKASMVEGAVLRKQAKADEEVINYLDLRGQEFEGRNAELSLRSEQLQAAYNLQCGSYSHRENQLFAELAEYKTKYEDLEGTYKSHKRVLVKEVKTLRSQLGTISSERNKYISQLLTVRNVLSLHSDNGI